MDWKLLGSNEGSLTMHQTVLGVNDAFIIVNSEVEKRVLDREEGKVVWDVYHSILNLF